MSSKLLDILVCPQCKEHLTQVESGQSFLCNRCQLKFPVRDGIPVMLVEEAIDMKSGGNATGEETRILGAKAPIKTPSRPVTRGQTAYFRVVDGPDANLRFELPLGTCRALGRASTDPNKTSILNVEGVISLDDEAKKLILQYISQQFRRSEPQVQKEEMTGKLGAFKRGADVVLRDQALSRLHAMIFYDEVGVGVLDLVSKNGTFVNGEEVESRLLKKGDTLELGETKVIFEG